MDKINLEDVISLIVDDLESARETVRVNLLKMGFSSDNIDMAGSCAEADDKLAAKAYDMVFLDWLMPGKSGLAMMQDYREKREFDHVAFVMVTAKANEKDVAAALKAGATSYIIKPTIPTEFQPNVRIALEWMAKVNPRFSGKVVQGGAA